MKDVILTEGLRTRLKPFTEIIFKPLLPIGEKSILEIQQVYIIPDQATGFSRITELRRDC